MLAYVATTGQAAAVNDGAASASNAALNAAAIYFIKKTQTINNTFLITKHIHKLT
jgi:hypothetical protein